MPIIENSIKRHGIHHTNYLYMEAVIFKSHIMCWFINHQGRGMYPCLKRYLATLMRSTTTEDDTYLLFEKSRKDVGFQMNKIFQVNVCPWLNTRGVRITNCIILQSVFLENVLPRIVWRLLLPQRGQYFEIVLARKKKLYHQLTNLIRNELEI